LVELFRYSSFMCSNPVTVTAVASALDALTAAELPAGFGGSAELAESVVALRRLADRLDGEILRRLAAVDRSGAAVVASGALSTAAWLRAETRMDAGPAAEAVRVARSLAGPLQATGQALRSGEISSPHARHVGQAVHGLSKEQTAKAEPVLLGLGRVDTPQQVRRAGVHLRHRLDPDTENERAIRQLEQRGITLSPTFDGMTSLSGLLDPVSAAVLSTAIGALTAPTSTQHPSPAAGAAGANPAQPVTAAELAVGAGAPSAAGGAGEPGEAAAGVVVAASRDTRSAAQRRLDALVLLCRHALDAGGLPDTCGVQPHVTLTLSAGTLAGRPGSPAADLDRVGPVPTPTARRVACDTTVLPLLLDGNGQVLDAGRTTRVPSPRLRRAVIARDRHCQFGTCDAPWQHCDLHHLIFWADGGPTSRDNLALICAPSHSGPRTPLDPAPQTRRKNRDPAAVTTAAELPTTMPHPLSSFASIASCGRRPAHKRTMDKIRAASSGRAGTCQRASRPEPPATPLTHDSVRQQRLLR